MCRSVVRIAIDERLTISARIHIISTPHVQSGERQCLFQHLVEVTGRQLAAIRAVEIAHPHDDASDAGQFVAGEGHEFGIAELGREILPMQVEAVAHGVERIVDLVGDSGGELAHRRQPRCSASSRGATRGSACLSKDYHYMVWSTRRKAKGPAKPNPKTRLN